jgi:uncharacterized protein YcnI
MKPSNLMKQLAALAMATSVAAAVGLAVTAAQAAPASKTIRVLSAAGVDAASPTPSGGWSSRWINSNSSMGTSGKVRIGYDAQSTVVTRSRS